MSAARRDRGSGSAKYRTEALEVVANGRFQARMPLLLGEARMETRQARHGGLGPRSARSSARTWLEPLRSAPRPPPPTSGCLSSARSGTGASSSAAADAILRSKVPAAVWDSGLPALSSASMPQRFRSAATRLASNAIRSDERGRLARRLERSPKRERDRLRFRRRVG